MKILKSFAITPLKKISILLAEDHAKFRRSLKLLVESDGELEVVGEAKNGREAVQMTTHQRPQVVIMDIAMPILNGMQATLQILKALPDTRILILSANIDPEYIEQAMKHGASGYLIKQSSTQFVTLAVREIMKGRAYFCTSISNQLRTQCRKIFVATELLKKNHSLEDN